MAGKYLRGSVWWITWSTAEGRHRESTGTGSERHAEILRRAKELELEIGRPVIVDEAVGPSLEELSILFLQHQARVLESAARDRQALDQALIPRFGHRKIAELERKDISEWILDRLDEVSPGTVRRELATLRRMYSLAIEWGAADRNPAARMQVPTDDDPEDEIRWYSTDQLQLLYDDPELGTVWQFYANTALRRNEGWQLRMDRVEDDRIIVLNQRGARTKGRKSRVVPLNAPAREAVKALKGQGEYLLPRIHPHTLTHYFTRYARGVGLPGSLHWLRHSFGHHWVRTGRSLRQLQLIMGHSSYKTTERYARLDTGELDVSGFSV